MPLASSASTFNLYRFGSYSNGSWSFASLTLEYSAHVEQSANESGSNDEFSAYERNDAYEYEYALDVVGCGSVGTYTETALETTSRTFDGTYAGGGTISDSSLITLGFTNSGTVSLASGELAFSSVQIAEGAFPNLPPILEGFDFSSSGGAPSAPSFGGGMDGPSAGGGGGVGGSGGGDDSGGQQGGGPKGPGGSGDGGGKGPEGGGGSQGDGSGPQVPSKIFVTADGRTGGDEPPPAPPRAPGAPQRRESRWQFRRWLDRTRLGRLAGNTYDGAVELPLVVWDLGQAVYAGISGDYDIEWRSMTGSAQSDAFDRGGRDGGRQAIAQHWNDQLTPEGRDKFLNALAEGDSQAWGNVFGSFIFGRAMGRIGGVTGPRAGASPRGVANTPGAASARGGVTAAPPEPMQLTPNRPVTPNVPGPRPGVRPGMNPSWSEPATPNVAGNPKPTPKPQPPAPRPTQPAKPDVTFDGNRPGTIEFANGDGGARSAGRVGGPGSDASGTSAPQRIPIPGDADFVGPVQRGWTLTPQGAGAHMVERVNVRGRAGLAAFDQPGTPRFYPTGTPENAGAAHVRLHQATRDAGIGLREGSNAALSDAQLLQRYRQAYSDPRLNGIRGELRTPDGRTVIARDVTPSEAFEALQRWHAGQ